MIRSPTASNWSLGGVTQAAAVPTLPPTGTISKADLRVTASAITYLAVGVPLLLLIPVRVAAILSIAVIPVVVTGLLTIRGALLLPVRTALLLTIRIALLLAIRIALLLAIWITLLLAVGVALRLAVGVLLAVRHAGGCYMAGTVCAAAEPSSWRWVRPCGRW